MAYVDQNKKARIAAALKLVIPKSWKWSLAVQNHSTIVLTIAQARVDLLAELTRVRNDRAVRRGDEAWREKPDHADINHYHLDGAFDGEVLETFKKIVAALNTDNHDRSDLND